MIALGKKRSFEESVFGGLIFVFDFFLRSVSGKIESLPYFFILWVRTIFWMPTTMYAM